VHGSVTRSSDAADDLCSVETCVGVVLVGAETHVEASVVACGSHLPHFGQELLNRYTRKRGDHVPIMGCHFPVAVSHSHCALAHQRLELEPRGVQQDAEATTGWHHGVSDVKGTSRGQHATNLGRMR